MDLGNELINAINPKDLFTIDIFGASIPVTDTVIITWAVMLFLIIAAAVLTRRMKTVPEGKQNFVELIVETINGLVKTNIGHHWEYFAAYLGTVLLFLIFANTVSIFNVIPGSEELYKLTHLEIFKKIPDIAIRPPTKDVNVTSCMAVMSILLVLFSGIVIKKPVGWLKGFFKPIPIIAPFKLLDYFIRPISLCFRLFANVLGGVIVMELLYFAIPVIVPAGLCIYFDLFDGILQAYIFVFLTSLYIAEAIE
jgi:F-type H+-transporting ATPase subunit a